MPAFRRKPAQPTALAVALLPCIFSLCCAPALAQSRDDAAATEAGGKDAVSLDTIRVSSSRIDRPGFDAPTPTTQITAEELAVVSHPNIADALNELPQFRATTSAQTTGTNTSAGQAPLDLRGLGTSRTLVLLDGRRFASDNDLNAIPQILVKSVDVVTGGASAAWGSGAVGGVVNIAMDGDFTGTKFETHFGRSTYSDANERGYGAAFGTDLAGGRGHLVVGGEFVENDGVVPKDSRSTIGGWASFANGDGTYTMTPEVGFSRAAYGGLIISGALAGKAFNPDGSLRDFDYGVVRGTAMAGGEAPSVDDYSPLVTPQTRYNVFGRFGYDLSDDVRLTAELRHSRVYDDYVYVGDDNTSGGITIRSDNAFLSDQVRAAMAAAGQSSFTMGRMNTDFALSHMDFERKATQATLALDGVFGNNWRWSAYYSHGETENNLNVSRRLLTQNYANAIDAVIDPATGQAVCRVTLANPGTNCVPINLFGDGAPSDAAADYVTGTPRSRATSKLDVGGADLRGEPWELPAGAVSVAFGIEARHESIRQTVDALSAANAYTRWNPSAMSGSYTVKEMFGEVLVPLLKDVPFFNDLQFNGAARISDYDTTGSIWSWKAGLTNEFFPGFKGRFTRSRDIRSANLTELYTQTTTGYNNIADPVTNTTGNILTNGGGNPDLDPETADTLTVGFAWSPAGVSGLDMSLDYFDITIDDVITSVGAQDIVTRCYNGNAEMCSRITRDADGNLARIVSTYANLAEYKTDGVDAEVAYSLPMQRLFANASGMLNLRLLGTWVHSLSTDDGVSQIDYLTSQGYSFSLGVPRWRANASIGYQSQRFGVDLRARYISAGNYNTTVNLTNNRIGSYVYWDTGFNYRVPFGSTSDVQLYANVSNLGNKKAPFGSLYSPYYDVIGRYYTVGARINF